MDPGWIRMHLQNGPRVRAVLPFQRIVGLFLWLFVNLEIFESNTPSDWLWYSQSEAVLFSYVQNSLLKKKTATIPFSKQALVFTCLQYNPFENTVGKGEIARTEQFLLFPQFFLLVWKTSCHVYKI